MDDGDVDVHVENAGSTGSVDGGDGGAAGLMMVIRRSKDTRMTTEWQWCIGHLPVNPKP